jgi:hypothetical protein
MISIVTTPFGDTCGTLYTYHTYNMYYTYNRIYYTFSTHYIYKFVQ